MKTKFLLRMLLILTLSLSSVSLIACSQAAMRGVKESARKVVSEELEQGATQLVKGATSLVRKAAASRRVRNTVEKAAKELAWSIVDYYEVKARIGDALDSVIGPSDPQLDSGSQVFSAESGVFSIRLDPIFQKPASEHDATDYTHVFQSQDQTTRLVITLTLVSDAPLSDSGWIEYLTELTSDFRSDLAIPPEAAQFHGILVSALSQDNDHLEWWIEESEGVVASVLYSTPMSRWETDSKQIGSYLRSFTWNPSAARAFLATGP